MTVVDFELKPEETDISIRIGWATISRGGTVTDLDLCCALYDAKVRLETQTSYRLYATCPNGPFPVYIVFEIQGDCQEIIDFNR